MVFLENNKHAIALIITSAALIGVLAAGRGSTVENRPLPSVVLPAAIEGWTKTNDLAFRKSDLEMLGTQNVVGGTFKNARNEAAQAVIVTAINNRSAFHPPEYCITGGGAELIEQRTVMAYPSGRPRFNFPVNERVFREGRGRKLLVWNWYAVGNKMTNNFYYHQLLLFKNLLSGRPETGMGVTLYAVINNDDVRSAHERNASLCSALLPRIREYLNGEGGS